jgi:hypothetical protein
MPGRRSRRPVGVCVLVDGIGPVARTLALRFRPPPVQTLPKHRSATVACFPRSIAQLALSQPRHRRAGMGTTKRVMAGTNTNLARSAHAAYLAGRGRAMGATTVRLRWQHRRWSRRRDRLDQVARARLLAVHDELRTRGSIPS